MKRPDVSLAKIAGALALLGTPAIMASCAKSAPAEKATSEPTRATTTEAPPPPIQAQTSASAAAAPLAVAPPDTKPADKVGDASAAAVAPGGGVEDAKKRSAKPQGMASCGAGTCAADPKKKK